MKTIVYRTLDKSTWNSGIWLDEPDKVQWEDKATKFPCLAVRHRELGHWCGYVGVSEEHVLYGKEYSDEAFWELEVHGGVTYTDFCTKDGDPRTNICHIPDESETDSIWWVGFDCAHAEDGNPIYKSFREYPYRTLQYVKDECASLALQLKTYDNTRKT